MAEPNHDTKSAFDAYEQAVERLEIAKASRREAVKAVDRAESAVAQADVAAMEAQRQLSLAVQRSARRRLELQGVSVAQPEPASAAVASIRDMDSGHTIRARADAMCRSLQRAEC